MHKFVPHMIGRGRIPSVNEDLGRTGAKELRANTLIKTKLALKVWVQILFTFK